MAMIMVDTDTDMDTVTDKVTAMVTDTAMVTVTATAKIKRENLFNLFLMTMNMNIRRMNQVSFKLIN